MPERIAAIVNPAATRASAGLVDTVGRTLAPFGTVDVAVTTHGGHAAELAREALRRGATLVVVAGGDGTINEAAGALADTDVGLLPLPAGSTNVFARGIGWPHPLGRALPAVAQALASPSWRAVRLGRIEAGRHDRLFCVNAGVGLDAETVHLVESRPWIKTRLRHAGFAGATLVATVREARSPPSIELVCDGRNEGRATTVLVAVGSPYAYLGRRRLDLVPGADIGACPGWIALRSPNPLRVAGTVAGALAGGRHLRSRSVIAGEACEALEMTASRPVAVQADGEPLGWHTAVRVVPGPELRVLVPAAG